MADPSEPTDPTDPADPVDPAEAEEERLGHRRSRWGRFRNALSLAAPPTRRANEDPRAIGTQEETYRGWP